jgi:hypothetical protein
MTYRFILFSSSILVALAPSCGSSPGKQLPECDSSQSSTLLVDDGSASMATGSVVQCLARSPQVDAQGNATCIALELRTVDTPEACVCDPAKGRMPVPDEHAGANDLALEAGAAEGMSWNCVCEIAPLTGPDADVCRTNSSDMPVGPSGNPVEGFCYIDATTTPPTGDPSLVALCPDTEKRALRFVGDPAKADAASLFTICSESDCN